MEINDILELLGGDKAVAEALGCGVPAISNWKSRGIPKGRWVDLVNLAASMDVALSLAEVQVAHEAIKPIPRKS